MQRARQIMSHTLPSAGKRRKKDMSVEIPDRFPGVTVRLDQSVSLRERQRGRLVHSRTEPELSLPPCTSSLPPAVANVPQEDIRGYAHSKKVYNYFVGATLGEGSFAKVKEAFHMLVGEKVCYICRKTRMVQYLIFRIHCDLFCRLQ